jgi:hypothetical protein
MVHTVVLMTLDTIGFYTIVGFIPLVALLRSSALMWRKERLWNVSVLQRVEEYTFPVLFSSECLFIAYPVIYAFNRESGK